MVSKRQLIEVLTGKKPVIDVLHYLVGNYRYRLYYKKDLRFLIRRHIFEQITSRIEWMNKTCYNQGNCIRCGCETTKLQMCNKSCDGLCYPEMMNKEEWKCFINGGVFNDKTGLWVRDAINGTPSLRYVTKDTLIKSA